MKYVLIAVVICFIPVACLATPYVPADEARALPADEAERHICAFPAGASMLSYDPLTRYEMACDFIVTMQVSDTASASYGGMREGEHMLGVIQTDNTSESIWMWTHYYDLTGSDNYRDNVDAAWAYCMTTRPIARRGTTAKSPDTTAGITAPGRSGPRWSSAAFTAIRHTRRTPSHAHPTSAITP